jgi:hypothetical protein
MTYLHSLPVNPRRHRDYKKKPHSNSPGNVNISNQEDPDKVQVMQEFDRADDILDIEERIRKKGAAYSDNIS